MALLDLAVERDFRRIVRLTERTIDRRGQHLLLPAYTLEGGWTSLTEATEPVIAPYERHGTHEQFNSEIQTDLDLERLPSGKFVLSTLEGFDCNDLVLCPGMFAYKPITVCG